MRARSQHRTREGPVRCPNLLCRFCPKPPRRFRSDAQARDRWSDCFVGWSDSVTGGPIQGEALEGSRKTNADHAMHRRPDRPKGPVRPGRACRTLRRQAVQRIANIRGRSRIDAEGHARREGRVCGALGALSKADSGIFTLHGKPQTPGGSMEQRGPAKDGRASKSGASLTTWTDDKRHPAPRSRNGERR